MASAGTNSGQANRLTTSGPQSTTSRAVRTDHGCVTSDGVDAANGSSWATAGSLNHTGYPSNNYRHPDSQTLKASSSCAATADSVTPRAATHH